MGKRFTLTMSKNLPPNSTKAKIMEAYDNPQAIEAFRMRTLRGALKLEVLGMKRRGPSVYSIVKKEFGFKGNKQKVLEQLERKLGLNTQGYGGSTRAPSRTDQDLKNKTF